MYWAYYALAKLGRWHDSKATGIVGWEALWDGWFVLSQLLEGAILIQQQIKEMRSSQWSKVKHSCERPAFLNGFSKKSTQG
jgi:hypothetical protein